MNGPITSTNRPDDERAERRRRREQAEAATRAEWAAHPGVKDKYEAPLTCPSCGHGFTAALRDEQDALDDALAAIRAEQAAGRITAAQAAAEREGLLTAHLARVAAIRARYLGEPG